MRRNRSKSKSIRHALWLTSLCMGAAASHAATVSVTCPAQTIQAAVDSAQPGDVINVSGSCVENVLIRNEKTRFTLDGQGLTTVNGSAGNNVFTVRGKGVVIKRFNIVGGAVGILVNRGSNATLDGNDISGATTDGIAVSELSNAVITGNNVHDNQRHGIHLTQSATARIGFNSYSDQQASPNAIQNNGRRGIQLNRASSAAIVGNTISNNGGHGIGVTGLSHADISSNIVNGNGGTEGGSGINVSQNSSIQLGEDGLASLYDLPNRTTVSNNQYGIRCTQGGVVVGYLGDANQLAGAVSQFGGGSSANSFSGTCPNSLVTSSPPVAVTSYTTYYAFGSTAASSATSIDTGGGTASFVAGNKSATVSASDAKGNFTTISGSYTKVLAFGGSAAGQLCNSGKGLLTFVISSAQPATVAELKGKTLKYYLNCAEAGYLTFNNDGSATGSDGTFPADIIAANFSSTGYSQPNSGKYAGKMNLNKLNAYKFVVDGVTRFAILGTYREDTSDLTNGGDTDLYIENF